MSDHKTRTLARLHRSLFILDLWSVFTNQVQLSTVPTTTALSSITIAGLPAGAVVRRAILFFKYRTIENINAGVNYVDGAQHIQVEKHVAGAWANAIDLPAGSCGVPATTRENGDVMMGQNDISAQIPANGAVMDIQWLSATSKQNNLNFNDVQLGLRIYYTV